MTQMPSQETVAAWAWFFRAHRILQEKVEADLKAAGMPPLSWYDVLWLVYDAPDRKVRQSEIGSRLLLPKHNLSRLLDRLSVKGLIIKAAFSGDKRGNIIEITPAGKKLLKQMWAVYGGAIQHHFGKIYTSMELSQLKDLASKVVSG
jgi:DNA-binding MarR family transcriptional regulator